MLRPLRIEYENAYYYVMNRGHGRKTVFHDERYYDAFYQAVGSTSTFLAGNTRLLTNEGITNCLNATLTVDVVGAIGTISSRQA